MTASELLLPVLETVVQYAVCPQSEHADQITYTPRYGNKKNYRGSRY